MKVVRDPIHGYIRLNDLAIDILDTREMQRLRRIRQLGFSYLVYPGANHTRFEHSLGVFHLTSVLLEHLNVREETEELLAAALIHDIGHGPYSHVSEPLIRKFTGKSHEDIEDIVLGNATTADADAENGDARRVRQREGAGRGERRGRRERGERGDARTVTEVLEHHDLDKRKVLSFVKGTEKLSGILKGEIDADKMDYLVRDAYYTGVAYGVIDNIRLIQGISMFEGEIVLTGKGIIPAEYLIFSRFLMYPTVYNHHTTRIAQAMFIRALEAYLEACEDARAFAFTLRRMDDYEVNVLLRHAKGFPREMIERINERRLFKRAFYRKMSEIDAGILSELEDERKCKEIEAEIARRARVERSLVILDVQRRETAEESAAKVLISEGHEGSVGSDEFTRSAERSGSEGRSGSEEGSKEGSEECGRGAVRSGGAVRLKPLREVSALVRMVERAMSESYNVGVYTIPEERDAVRKAAEAVLC
ncbi:MAG: HD domain-containing protein [Candidatus Methanospirare jalkutatii]|nr:HD domain-containing protein [Candidatus Methanospirare jalkutatii]